MPGNPRRFLLYSALTLSRASPIPAQEKPTKDQIKASQILNDSRDEGSLERMIEQEYGFNLRIDSPYDPNMLRRFYNIVGEIHRCNPALVASARGLDIHLLPGWKDALYVATCTAGKEMEYYKDSMTDAGTVVHEWAHSQLTRKKDFWDKWCEIVSRHGFQYNSNLTFDHQWVNWTDYPYEPQGVFCRPYASKNKHEHAAEIRRYIYENRPFQIDSREAFDCYKDLLRHCLNSKVFSEIEYAQGIKLLSPAEIIKPDTDIEKLAGRWKTPWCKIAEANQLWDIKKIEGPYKAFIPIIEINDAAKKEPDYLLHQARPNEKLQNILVHYKPLYPYLTEKMLIDNNPKIVDPDKLREFEIVNIPLIRNGASWYREIPSMASFAGKAKVNYGY